jgi:hypothetical protein
MAFKIEQKLLLSLVAGCMMTLFLGCERTQELEVGVLWNDDSHFSNNNSRYLALVEGEFDLETGFETSLVELTPVTPGTNATHKWSLGSSSSQNYTAFVFIDINESASYDEGLDIVSGYKYNCVSEGECLSISVSSFY